MEIDTARGEVLVLDPEKLFPGRKQEIDYLRADKSRDRCYNFDYVFDGHTTNDDAPTARARRRRLRAQRIQRDRVRVRPDGLGQYTRAAARRALASLRSGRRPRAASPRRAVRARARAPCAVVAARGRARRARAQRILPRRR